MDLRHLPRYLLLAALAAVLLASPPAAARAASHSFFAFGPALGPGIFVGGSS